jgi:ubiquinone/menaquinone biosynthesis C-methylase UbiE
MDLEKQVAAHYTTGVLEQKILDALQSAGRDTSQLKPEDLVAIEDFHIGGREATQALAEFMNLRPGMHLLDVGCGIGGPARYFAGRGCKVTGIDLSEEFIRTADSLTRRVKLEPAATFRQASALELPFAPGTFDGAYQIHVGMNISDKLGVFCEVARVLKTGARFAIFDIVQTGNGSFEFPVPWAKAPETSFVASVEQYRQALKDAGLEVVHERGRHQFAVEFIQKRMAAAAASNSTLGVNLLMGELAPAMLKNINVAIASGVLEPVELVAVKP